MVRLLLVRLRCILAVQAMLIVCLLAADWVPAMAAPVASCGDIVINEVKFKQTDSSDGGVPAGDEWVELYVVNAIATDATVIVDDLETTTSGRFRLEFTVPAGTPAGKYIIVHDNATGSGESLPSGSAVNATEYFSAGGSGGSGAGVHLNDSGDNIVLTIDGAACEEVHWGTRGSDANIAPPSTAAITIAFGSASSIAAGESIQRSPSGSGISFLRAGTGVSGSTAVGTPTTMGYSNNTTANAVTLAFFGARPRLAATGAFPALVVLPLLAGVAIGRRRIAGLSRD